MGSCTGTCRGTTTSAICDGQCEGDFEPIRCVGGKLEGGCQSDAKCDANCDVSNVAKAECAPPNVDVAVTGAANIQAAGKLATTLKSTLGPILAHRARLQGMAAVSQTVTGNASSVSDIKAACIPPVVATAASAVSEVAAVAQATAAIVAAAGTN
jgi:hypothetical protein